MDATDVARALYDRWEAQDAEGALILIDADVEFVRIGDALGDLAGEWHGREAMVETIWDWLRSWEELRLTADRYVDLGDGRVLVLDRQRGRGRSSSVVLEHELGTIVTVHDGLVTRIVSYWDRGEAIRAAGLDPAQLTSLEP